MTIEAFLTYLSDDRAYSPNTVKTYRRGLRRLANPDTATRTDLQTWWDSRTHLAPATRATELSAVRAYYRWAILRGHRPDDPSAHLIAPKVRNANPHPIGQAAVDLLLGEATADRPDLRRAIALGLYGGMRIHEVAKADWRDVDDQRRLTVVGKGGKVRTVPLSARLRGVVGDRGVGNIVTGCEDGFSDDWLGRLCNRLIREVAPGHTFHDLRKRCATRMLDGGAPMTVVQVFLGWGSLSTVQHYVRSELDALVRAADLVT